MTSQKVLKASSFQNLASTHDHPSEICSPPHCFMFLYCFISIEMFSTNMNYLLLYFYV